MNEEKNNVKNSEIKNEKTMMTLLWVYSILSLLDITSTYLSSSRSWFLELNPLLNFLFLQIGVFMTMFMITVVRILLSYGFFKVRKTKYAIPVIVLNIVAIMIVVILNISNNLKMEGFT